MSLKEKEEIGKIIREWKECGIVMEADSPYASSVFIVPKKSGSCEAWNCDPVLTLYNPQAETELHTDASCQGLAGGLPLQKDLSYSYNDDTLMWPGGEKFHYTEKRRMKGKDWYAANDYATAEHSGTHLDAPYHFCEHGKPVDQIPLEKLITKGIIIDASSERAGEWNYALPQSVLESWEKEHGDIPENSVVLLSFGWAHKYPNKTEYMGPSDSDLRFPGLSTEAADWLVKRKVAGVGLDTPSIDVSSAKEAPVHRILCCNDIYILENVALADKKLPHTMDLIILPMKLKDGSGAPARIVAKI